MSARVAERRLSGDDSSVTEAQARFVLFNRRCATGRSRLRFPALKRRDSVNSRSAAGESNLKIHDKVTGSQGSQTMKITNQTSRRHFLRGAGVALALPWLESLPCMAQGGSAPATENASKPPIRFAHIFFSNG